MRSFFILLAATTFATAALAQQFKWIDKDGKVHYGDTLPPGVKATPLKPPPGSVAPPPGAAKSAAAKDKSAAAKDVGKGPLTPAEQEQDFRKRKLEEQKAAEKTDDERKEAEAKRENCQRAQEQQRTLEAGGRIARTDAKGERYYLEDAQIAQEAAKARELVKQWCN